MFIKPTTGCVLFAAIVSFGRVGWAADECDAGDVKPCTILGCEGLQYCESSNPDCGPLPPCVVSYDAYFDKDLCLTQSLGCQCGEADHCSGECVSNTGWCTDPTDGCIGSCTESGCPPSECVDADMSWGDCQPTGSCDPDNTCSEDSEKDCCDDKVGEPINVITGTVTFESEPPDIHIELGEGILELRRAYSSKLAMADNGPLKIYSPVRAWGGGWYHQYEHSIIESIGDDAEDTVYFHRRPNGSTESYDYLLSGQSRPWSTLSTTTNGFTLAEDDGTILEFEEAQPGIVAGASAKFYRLIQMTKVSGQLIDLYYYSEGGVGPCDSISSGTANKLCMAVSGGAYFWIRGYYPGLPDDYARVPVVRYVEYGRLPASGASAVTSGQPTYLRYTYDFVTREEAPISLGSCSVDTDCDVVTECSGGCICIDDECLDHEPYTVKYPLLKTARECVLEDPNTCSNYYRLVNFYYTNESYHRPDLTTTFSPLANPYATISTIVAPDGLDAYLLTRVTNSSLVTGWEYDQYGRGAADVSAGNLLTFAYFEQSGYDQTLVLNESTDTVVDYRIENGQIVQISDACGCGDSPAGGFERNANNRIYAEIGLDPDGSSTQSPMRITYTYDSQDRIVLEVDNCTVTDPQDFWDDINGVEDSGDVSSACGTGPVRLRRYGYIDGSASLRDYESKGFSALCNRSESEFSSLCSGDYEEGIERVYSGKMVQSETTTGQILPAASPSTPTEVTRTVTYSRDATNGNRLDTVTDNAGSVTQYVYYGASDTDLCGESGDFNEGQIKRIEWQAGSSTTVLVQRGDYDKAGRVGCTIDQAGVETTYQYDEIGRLETITVGNGSQQRVTELAYNPNNQITSTTSGGITHATSFGAENGACAEIGNAPWTQDPTGDLFNDCLDALGEMHRPVLESTSVAAGSSSFTLNQRMTNYNERGSPILLTQLDGNDNIRRRVGFNYDASGNRTEKYKYVSDTATADYINQFWFDTLNRETYSQSEAATAPDRSIQYDALGRISSVTVGLNTNEASTTTYTYDAHDNLASVTTDAGTTSYLYDDFGQLVWVVSPDSGETRYFYDGAGNLTEKWVLESSSAWRKTAYAYDSRSRLTGVTFAYDGSGTQDQDRTYQYDDEAEAARFAACEGEYIGFSQDYVGGRLSMVDSESTVTYYSYTPFGQIAAVYELAGAPNEFDVCDLSITRYTYDDSGRLLTINYPSHRTIQYEYRPGELFATKVSMFEPGSSTEVALADNMAYDIDGQIAGYTSNGVSYDGDWDLAGQGTYRRYIGNAGDSFYWTIKERDGAGNITKVGDAAKLKELTLEYDGQERLSSAVTAEPPNGKLRGYQDCEYTYDGAGNRLTETCFPDEDNKTITYAYDQDTSRLSGLSWTAGGSCGVSLDLDAEGRPTTYYPRRFPSSSEVMGLGYDDNGRLAAIDFGNNGSNEIAYTYDHRELRVSDGTTWFTYDSSGRLIGENSGTSNASVEYVWLAGMPIAMLVDDDGVGTGDATVYTLGVDHLGTPMRAWDDTASFVWSADYEAFGKAWEYLPESTSPPTVLVNLRFPGQYLDRETGLHYNWHRYYDPNTGRYLTPDPHMDPLNVYSYAMNRPCCIIDPFGLYPISLRCPPGWNPSGVPRLLKELGEFEVLVGSEGRSRGTVQIAAPECSSGVKQCQAVEGAQKYEVWSMDLWAIECEKDGEGCSGKMKQTITDMAGSFVAAKTSGQGLVYEGCQCVPGA